eukprot:TRINITY_DN770_c0_g2_i1.p1 TRINITY_DN770_c0_g2~~TRINITY_DN770_c0_g2_i1.p1  ORF type:complete len:296 (-),score=22.33 TRINITY_DN770_c0_g2_i1:21-908(-)
MFQGEFNTLFQGPNYDVAFRYGLNIRALYFAGFFMALYPAGLLFTIVEIFLRYWIDKFVLLRRSSMPTPIGKRLSSEILGKLEYLPLIVMAGYFIVLTVVNSKGFALDGIALIISLVYILIPKNSFVRNTCCNEQRIPKRKCAIPYSQARLSFINDYDLLNPVTSVTAKQEWVQMLISNETDEQNKKELIELEHKLQDQSKTFMLAQVQQSRMMRRSNQAVGYQFIVPQQLMEPALLRNLFIMKTPVDLADPETRRKAHSAPESRGMQLFMPMHTVPLKLPNKVRQTQIRTQAQP